MIEKKAGDHFEEKQLALQSWLKDSGNFGRENVWEVGKGEPWGSWVRESWPNLEVTQEACRTLARQGKKQTKNVWGRTWKENIGMPPGCKLGIHKGAQRKCLGEGKEMGEAGAISMKKAVWVYDAGWWQAPLKTWVLRVSDAIRPCCPRAQVLRTSQKQVSDETTMSRILSLMVLEAKWQSSGNWHSLLFLRDVLKE